MDETDLLWEHRARKTKVTAENLRRKYEITTLFEEPDNIGHASHVHKLEFQIGKTYYKLKSFSEEELTIMLGMVLQNRDKDRDQPCVVYDGIAGIVKYSLN